MGEALWFWFAKFLVELGIGLLLVSPLLIMLFRRWLKQQFCKHPEFYENRACHGICRGCGKDLGFIQPLRDARNKKEV
uniref:Membrane protein n=1 Tax=Pseudomonas phage HRDY3 TaxID=3236930 RepID=A0AB39CEB2_9VIRU